MSVLQFINIYRDSIFIFTLFAVFHSVGSHEGFKEALAKVTGQFFIKYFWRLIYCALSYWMLFIWFPKFHFYRHWQMNDLIIHYPDWLNVVVVVVHLFSVGVMYCAFIQADYLEFLGFKQAWRGIIKIFKLDFTLPELKLFGTDRLEITGIYKWIRHPMLAGGLWYGLTLPPTPNYIFYVVMLTIYIFIGVYYEEQRLIRVFGDQYREYQRHVGAFIPKFLNGSY